MAKETIVRADVPNDKAKRKELVVSGLESGITAAIVRPGDDDFASLGNVALLYNDNGSISGGEIRLFELKTPKDQDEAMSLAGKVRAVILGTSDWTVIPLENLIARFRNSGTKVFACASDPEQAKLYLQTLEKGVDGIVIDVGNGNDVRKFSGILAGTGDVELVSLEVISVRNIEMGDRVCVDTVSMMKPGEGMLVGSSASCLFLIQSESEDNGYVAARPFRVNAGAVHAYVMAPDGKTRYLSELRSGEPVVLTDSEGHTRTSSVGRCKIEQRPLVILEATDGKEKYSTILQNAETVKLSGPDGSISVSKLKKGDKVYARLESGGRHFGMKIDETIREI
ncbi:MAG: 3-dehydroquinate synthase II [Candidatus Methanoplasma sp.]|jgi:3-dehydroquinate synthase II|nr:3-dehydroquinate synthase II [Candidatus Methanoplasma sp.]